MWRALAPLTDFSLAVCSKPFAAFSLSEPDTIAELAAPTFIYASPSFCHVTGFELVRSLFPSTTPHVMPTHQGTQIRIGMVTGVLSILSFPVCFCSTSCWAIP